MAEPLRRHAFALSAVGFFYERGLNLAESLFPSSK
jgi:hypothetical protein